MQKLSEFTIKSVERSMTSNPVQQRRSKLLAKLKEQFEVLEAAKRGETYTKTRTVWVTHADGHRVQAQRTRAVRRWFFEQDGGWYVQCRYGAKPLTFGGKGNALFVPKLDDVEGALSAMHKAVIDGEMDSAIIEALKGRISAGVKKAKG